VGRRSVRITLAAGNAALVTLLATLVASCGGSGTTSEGAIPTGSTTTGVPSAGVQIGDQGISDTSALVFDTFTPVPASGWGADLAETAMTYRPDPDGLAFANAAPPEPFGVDDAIALFGEHAVCEEASGPCTPRAPAQAWIDKVAASSVGGVCEGLVLFSLDRFVAGAQPPTMQLPVDAELNNRVMRLFGTQFLPDVVRAAASTRGQSLSKVVDEIRTGLEQGPSPYTLGIYQGGQGHTLLPYAVRSVTPSRVALYVYDPNWPATDRFIEFDLDSGSWRYSFDTADPASDRTPWFGTGADMDLVPLVVREAPFDEPFAGAGNGDGRTLLTVTTSGQHWSVRNGGEVVTVDSAVPGKGSVVSVSRGGLGSTTIVIEAHGDVAVESDGSLDVMSEGERGALRGRNERGGRFEVSSGSSPGIRAGADGSELRTYLPDGVVSADVGSGGSLEIVGDRKVRFTGSDDPGSVVELPGGERHDYDIDAHGSASEVDVPAAPAEVRDAARQPLLGSPAVGNPTESTVVDTSSPEPSTVAGSTVPVNTSSTTTTVKPTTTSTTALPPNTSSRVDVVVEFGTTAAFVTVKVIPKSGFTGSFTVGVSGPQWSSLDGPTSNYVRTFQNLVANGYYLITVKFSDNLTLTRNFTAP